MYGIFCGTCFSFASKLEQLVFEYNLPSHLTFHMVLSRTPVFWCVSWQDDKWDTSKWSFVSQWLKWAKQLTVLSAVALLCRSGQVWRWHWEGQGHVDAVLRLRCSVLSASTHHLSHGGHHPQNHLALLCQCQGQWRGDTYVGANLQPC